jgi:hypothetical protein
MTDLGISFTRCATLLLEKLCEPSNEMDSHSSVRPQAALASMLIQTVESPSFTIIMAAIRLLEKRCGAFSKQ